MDNRLFYGYLSILVTLSYHNRSHTLSLPWGKMYLGGDLTNNIVVSPHIFWDIQFLGTDTILSDDFSAFYE